MIHVHVAVDAGCSVLWNNCTVGTDPPPSAMSRSNPPARLRSCSGDCKRPLPPPTGCRCGPAIGPRTARWSAPRRSGPADEAGTPQRRSGCVSDSAAPRPAGAGSPPGAPNRLRSPLRPGKSSRGRSALF